MLRTQIKKWFFEAVRLDATCKQELKDVLLKGHPRLEVFIENLTGQILAADKILQAKGKVLKQKTIQDTVYDMAKVFIMTVELEAQRRYESDLARLAREAEKDKLKEFDAVLKGEQVGEFAEAGVITNEKIDAEREVGGPVKEA